jgi:hypothetical protein
MSEEHVAASTTTEAPPEPSPETVERIQSEVRAIRSRGARTLDGAVTNVRLGLREAERRLEDEAKAWDAHARAATLPDVGSLDPMVDLAVRIDRESDYWRGFAVGNLRPGAARNLAIAGGVLALASGLALAVLGTLAAFFGSEGPAAASLMTASGVALCAVVACALGIMSERGRVMAAREALARADHAERRLERVAAILALKTVHESKYIEALARLERDR